VAFLDTSTMESKEPLPGWAGRFFNSENLTFGYYDTVAGASIHEHSQPNEEIWHIVDGELEVTIGRATRVAGPGCVAIVPANTTHSVRVLSPGRVIVVDYPRRSAIGNATLD